MLDLRRTLLVGCCGCYHDVAGSFPIAKITAKKTVGIFEDIFSQLGLPKIIVSDNGTQFTASEFK
jgi:Fe-S oxidoreductase